MYGYPSQVRGSNAYAKRRHNEILQAVQANRMAAQAERTARQAPAAGTASPVGVTQQQSGRWIAALLSMLRAIFAGHDRTHADEQRRGTV